MNYVTQWMANPSGTDSKPSLFDGFSRLGPTYGRYQPLTRPHRTPFLALGIWVRKNPENPWELHGIPVDSSKSVTKALLQWSLELVYKAPMMAGKRTSLPVGRSPVPLGGSEAGANLGAERWITVPSRHESSTRALVEPLEVPYSFWWSQKANDSGQALADSFIYGPTRNA